MIFYKNAFKLISSFGFVLTWVLICAHVGETYNQINLNNTYSKDTLQWYDSIRQRSIPVAIYEPNPTGKQTHFPIVIISHGYNANSRGSYLGYSFLAEHLASNGVFVISIQHELPTDSLVPFNGIPQIVRRPFWDRGVDNIYFVINHLKKTKPNLNFNQITLIGHSMGGDMTALFPQKYPNLVEKIITFDNRRMALPRTKTPRVYTLRSSDQPADSGVIPTKKEIKKYNMKIIYLADIKHNDMCNNANEQQRKELIKYVSQFLSE